MIYEDRASSTDFTQLRNNDDYSHSVFCNHAAIQQQHKTKTKPFIAVDNNNKWTHLLHQATHGES